MRAIYLPVLVVSVALFLVSPSLAEITCTGYCNPSTFDGPVERVYIGGEIIVDGQSSLETAIFTVNGFGPSRGIATVTGPGSEINVTAGLCVGFGGDGVLNIYNSGVVNAGDVYSGMASNPSTEHSINLYRGTLNCRSLFSRKSDLRGIGVINTGGIVSDIDWAFDSADDLSKSFILNESTDQNVTLNYSYTGNGCIGAGWYGSASVVISNGMNMTASSFVLGEYEGSNGVATIIGNNTYLSCRKTDLGLLGGKATLNIFDGAQVESDEVDISYSRNADVSVNVSGLSSRWQVGNCVLGLSGNAEINICNGGTLHATGDEFAIDIESEYDNGINYDSEILINILGAESKLVVDSTLSFQGRDDFINMSCGAMLALMGEADKDIEDFMSLIEFSDGCEIRYFDTESGQWLNIAQAVNGVDYSLAYITEGELAGHTVLQVDAVSEPASLVLLGSGVAVILNRRRKA